MILVERSGRVDAPIEAVWEVVQQAEQLPDWMAGVRWVEVVSGEGVGRRQRVHAADGTWLEPFALAAGLDDRDNYARWGRWPDIAVNRRGDALATWATSRRTPDTWIRYQPAGHDWSRPRRLPTDAAPQVLRTALGDCGHAAFTWTTTGPRKLHTMRALPSP